jgi:hypothetical protein
MCYIDGQKNKYSVLNKCNRMLKYNITEFHMRFIFRMGSIKILRGLSPLASYTERPPLVGEVSADFCGQRVPRDQREGSLRSYSRLSRPDTTTYPSDPAREFESIIYTGYVSFIISILITVLLNATSGGTQWWLWRHIQTSCVPQFPAFILSPEFRFIRSV